jgi:predicted nucleic acid-binding Zn ribbon protein
MPSYTYVCPNLNCVNHTSTLEFWADRMEGTIGDVKCPECKSVLQRVYDPVDFQFKSERADE